MQLTRLLAMAPCGWIYIVCASAICMTPDNHYSGPAQLGNARVDFPDVCNEHGVLLNVSRTKLQDGDVVEVEVILKLHVCSIYFLRLSVLRSTLTSRHMLFLCLLGLNQYF
ncbi:uncharacterized protein F5147DRAFT_715578 [Suillus discolor]|uniref:Uncharacterized protein n=1 Tax=Suillus discolor TaxID=1912936 RepID=A0A9P7JQ57_9AGAM|nr:uncharacterized protein F5147DRAFT_715578 [Suillus discolor]KAG2096977.1 hypothetical protein F5147DRAFT_715578 [Suillus discolor]